MRILNTSHSIVFAAGALLLAATSTSVYAHPQPQPLRITMKSPATENIVVGEPITIKLEITNCSNVDLKTNLGQGWAKWYSIELKNSSGVPIQAVRQSFVQDGSGFRPSGISIPAGSTHTEYIVPNRDVYIAHPGRYTLDLPLDIRFSQDSLSSGVKTISEKPMSGVVQKTLAVTIDVSPVNPPILVTEAESLANRITKEHDLLKQATLIQELCSMPADTASGAWKQLAANASPFYADTLSDELARTMSPQAVDALALIAWPSASQKDQLSDEKFRAREDLGKMYAIGGPELRNQIALLFNGNGLPLPGSGIVANNSDN